MTTKEYRNTDKFLRNLYPGDGRWEIPIVHDSSSITVDMLRSMRWLPCSSTRRNETQQRRRRGVHHFVGDEHIPNIYANPERTLEKYSQYAVVLTPDNSTYREMPQFTQLEAVWRSRWIGAYWQAHGLTVIPTVTWSDVASFDFCFCGLEYGSTVAVSTVGCRNQFEGRTNFMHGFSVMIERVQPRLVLCIGAPFLDMYHRGSEIVAVSYQCPKWGVH